MNSINGVLVRIQEILTRIQEIRAADGRVPGYGPSSARSAPTAPSGPSAPSSPSVATTSSASSASSKGSAANGLSPSKVREFQQLLEQTLAAQTNGLGIGSSSSSGSLPSGGLTGLGSGLSNLESILGPNAGTSGSAGVTNSQPMQQYQQELLQALQQLAAQKKQGST